MKGNDPRFAPLAALVDLADLRPPGSRLAGKPESALPPRLRHLSKEERAELELTREDRLPLIPFAKIVRMGFANTWTKEGYIREAYRPLLEETGRDGNPLFTNLEKNSNCKSYWRRSSNGGSDGITGDTFYAKGGDLQICYCSFGR